MDKQLLEQEAKEFAENLCPIKTEEEYYKDNVETPYFDYASTGFIIHKDLQAAYIAGATSSSTVKEKNNEIEFLNKNCDNLNEVINDCGKEIGRLKGLIEKLVNAYSGNDEKYLERFKTENNL